MTTPRERIVAEAISKNPPAHWSATDIGFTVGGRTRRYVYDIRRVGPRRWQLVAKGDAAGVRPAGRVDGKPTDAQIATDGLGDDGEDAEGRTLDQRARAAGARVESGPGVTRYLFPDGSSVVVKPWGWTVLPG